MQDEQEVVPLRCIQTEEFALKELSALFGAAASVSQHPTEPPPAPKPRGSARTPRARGRRTGPTANPTPPPIATPAVEVDPDAPPPGL